jgi:FkbM family methyltransferase
MKRYENSQGVFFIDEADQMFGTEIERGYHLELGLAMHYSRPEDHILVLGAHVGAVAIPLSAVRREVVAVEANPRTFRALVMNVNLNRRPNIRSLQAAANDQTGEIQFVLNTRNSGSSKRMPKFAHRDYFDDDPQIVTVVAWRMDDLVMHTNLIFMDIEGSEHAAMLGMPRLLGEARAVITEFLPHHLTHVAGITVEQFVEPLLPHFDRLEIPGVSNPIEQPAFVPLLQGLVDRGVFCPAIVFYKSGGSYGI